MTTTKELRMSTDLWTEGKWEAITDHLAMKFRLNDEEKAIVAGTKVAELIAAIPFIAGCDQPMETSLANMAVYMMSVGPGKEAFNATPEDDQDIFARLSLARFDGGDRAIVDRGMNLLALNMLSDYRRDVVVDTAYGKHNPVATGAWDYESLEEELMTKIEAVDCPQMDAIITAPEIKNAYWLNGMFPSWM